MQQAQHSSMEWSSELGTPNGMSMLMLLFCLVVVLCSINGESIVCVEAPHLIQ